MRAYACVKKGENMKRLFVEPEMDFLAFNSKDFVLLASITIENEFDIDDAFWSEQ